MLSNNETNFDFGDSSYEDNYENATMTGSMFDSSKDIFSGNTDNLFDETPAGDNQGVSAFSQQNISPFDGQPVNMGSPNFDYNGQQNMQGMYQQGMQGMYQQPNMQQNPQDNIMMDNLRKQVGKVVDNGGVNLSSKHVGLIVIAILIIGLLLAVGIHSCATRPKAQKVEQPTSYSAPIQASEGVQQAQQPVVERQSAPVSTVSNTDTLNLVVVGDNVPIDYTSAELTNTGLITGKTTYVVDNQVLYCLDISMTVGSDTRRIRHFCNRKLFQDLNQGTVVEVHYQQVDEHNIAVFDITM